MLAERIDLPAWVRGIGWALIVATTVLGTVADRQIGIRVRTFTPFFEPHGRIELRTTGAYGIVRHPIYAAGIGFQLGAVLVTGYLAVVAALVVLALGAMWFTRQEERQPRAPVRGRAQRAPGHGVPSREPCSGPRISLE